MALASRNCGLERCCNSRWRRIPATDWSNAGRARESSTGDGRARSLFGIATTTSTKTLALRPVVAVFAAETRGGAERSRGSLLFPRPMATTATPREKSRSSSRIAAKRDENETENNSSSKPQRGGLLSRWSQLTAREKSVVTTFIALAVLFGPRLLLLSLVSLEAAATGALLAAERALGAAFLTSFAWLAGLAALLLAGLLVYFLILEEERLEDSSSDEE